MNGHISYLFSLPSNQERGRNGYSGPIAEAGRRPLICYYTVMAPGSTPFAPTDRPFFHSHLFNVSGTNTDQTASLPTVGESLLVVHLGRSDAVRMGEERLFRVYYAALCTRTGVIPAPLQKKNNPNAQLLQ